MVKRYGQPEILRNVSHRYQPAGNHAVFLLCHDIISMGKYEKDLIQWLTHWGYVFLALSHRYDTSLTQTHYIRGHCLSLIIYLQPSRPSHDEIFTNKGNVRIVLRRSPYSCNKFTLSIGIEFPIVYTSRTVEFQIQEHIKIIAREMVECFKWDRVIKTTSSFTCMCCEKKTFIRQVEIYTISCLLEQRYLVENISKAKTYVGWQIQRPFYFILDYCLFTCR